MSKSKELLEVAEKIYSAWDVEVDPAVREGWDELKHRERDNWCLVAEAAIAAVHKVPTPMRLPCPGCGVLHVDVALDSVPHVEHACQSCGAVWRPAIVPTVGVLHLPRMKEPLSPRAASTWQVTPEWHEKATDAGAGHAVADLVSPPVGPLKTSPLDSLYLTQLSRIALAVEERNTEGRSERRPPCKNCGRTTNLKSDEKCRACGSDGTVTTTTFASIRGIVREVHGWDSEKGYSVKSLDPPDTPKPSGFVYSSSMATQGSSTSATSGPATDLGLLTSDEIATYERTLIDKRSIGHPSVNVGHNDLEAMLRACRKAIAVEPPPPELFAKLDKRAADAAFQITWPTKKASCPVDDIHVAEGYVRGWADAKADEILKAKR